ncbi:hypothetical protein, partial [Endozoicomonas sp. ONNA1]|uniref:hypothetical protein n=1 Tax=Endozoicomonas sp. ONNA1 TaxID=2828740 RepID=UPI002148EC31
DIQRSWDKVLVDAYQNMDASTGLPPKYGPVGKVHFYEETYNALMALLLSAEQNADNLVSGNMVPDQVNPVSAMYNDGVPYHAIEVMSEQPGNITLGEKLNHFFIGGEDGTLSVEKYEEGVARIMQSGYQDPMDPLENMATHPFSMIWDCGFTIDTKKELCRVLGHRKDVGVVLSTHVDGEESLNWVEEEALGNQLKNIMAAYPESTYYGTPVARGVVVAGSGTYSGSSWTRPISVTLDLADKVARFAGAGDGKFKADLGFDVPPNNQITLLRDLTNTYKPVTQRIKDWDAGLVWAQSYDRRSNFYPGIQTVYNDDTSIMNSMINMIIEMELQKVCFRVWRDLSGNSKLTTEQFIERSDRLIERNTVGRFDDRVTIIPETYFTEGDEARGYSWSCKIHMYGANMMTVGTFTVVSHRNEDLTA